MASRPFVKVRVRWSYIRSNPFREITEEAVMFYVGEANGIHHFGTEEYIGDDGIHAYGTTMTHQAQNTWIRYLEEVPDHVPMQKPKRITQTLSERDMAARAMWEWLLGDTVRVEASWSDGQPFLVEDDGFRTSAPERIDVIKHVWEPIQDSATSQMTKQEDGSFKPEHRPMLEPRDHELNRMACAKYHAEKAGVQLRYRIDQTTIKELIIHGMQEHDPTLEGGIPCVDCGVGITINEDMVYEPLPELHDQAVGPAHPRCAEINGFTVTRAAVVETTPFLNPEGQCQWFLTCANDATTTRPHPILGAVPICDTCNARAELLS